MLDVMIRVHVSIITLFSPIIYMASPNFQHQNTGLASCSVWLIRPPLSGNKSIPRCGVRQLSHSRYWGGGGVGAGGHAMFHQDRAGTITLGPLVGGGGKKHALQKKLTNCKVT